MRDEDLTKLKIDKFASVLPPPDKRKSLRRIILLVVILLAILFLLWLSFSPAIEVRVATVSKIYPFQKFTVLNASGYVVAQRKASVASKVTGRLDWLGVQEGSHIKKGQVIARLDNSDVIAARQQAAANLRTSISNLAQAKAELQDARLQYGRLKTLVSLGAIAKTQLDTAEARYHRAQAAVSGAESSINASQAALRETEVVVEHTIVRAPFDAVVLTKNADVGDIVTPLGAAANAKAAVVTIADMDSLQVEADVAESNLQKVWVGQPCEVQLDAMPGSHLSAVVSTIVPTADRTKATVMTKIRFLEKNSRILPEMSSMVSFLQRAVRPEEKQPRTAVNVSSIVKRGNKDVLFLAEENKAVMRPVILGRRAGDMIEIRSGAKVGDKVIENPPEKLKNGSKIKITEV